MEGIEEALVLPASTDHNLYEDGEGLAALPDSLAQAVVLAKESDFVRRVLPEELLEKYLALKAEEAQQVESSTDRFAAGRARYFNQL